MVERAEERGVGGVVMAKKESCGVGVDGAMQKLRDGVELDDGPVQASAVCQKHVHAADADTMCILVRSVGSGTVELV